MASFVIKTDGTPLTFNVKDIDLLPEDKGKVQIGIYFKILGVEQWSDILAQSLSATLYPTPENATRKEVDEIIELNQERIKANVEFETGIMQNVVEKIVCRSKSGITIGKNEYGMNEVIFEKKYENGEATYSEEQRTNRDLILNFSPMSRKAMWNTFTDIMNNESKKRG